MLKVSREEMIRSNYIISRERNKCKHASRLRLSIAVLSSFGSHRRSRPSNLLLPAFVVNISSNLQNSKLNLPSFFYFFAFGFSAFVTNIPSLFSLALFFLFHYAFRGRAVLLLPSILLSVQVDGNLLFLSRLGIPRSSRSIHTNTLALKVPAAISIGIACFGR